MATLCTVMRVPWRHGRPPRTPSRVSSSLEVSVTARVAVGLSVAAAFAALEQRGVSAEHA
jgi:hypothetical protein